MVRDDRLVSRAISAWSRNPGLIGIYEKANPNTVWEDGCPWEAENELFAPDYDRIMPWLENAMDAHADPRRSRHQARGARRDLATRPMAIR